MAKVKGPAVERTVHADHTVINPPNTLRAKALSQSRQSPEEVARMVARADQALAALAPSFDEWMRSETQRLLESYVVFEAGPRGPEEAKTFFRVAHDIRGQALQFGFPIVSQLAAGLCELLCDDRVTAMPTVLLRRYVEAIGSIVRSGVRDERNELARELVHELATVSAGVRSRLPRPEPGPSA